jgi:hypothetical protein
MCLWLAILAWEGESWARLSVSCGSTCLVALLSISGLRSQGKAATKPVWLVVTSDNQTFSFKSDCDSSLFSWRFYHGRSITIVVFVGNLIRVLICQLDSLFLVHF